MSAFPQATFHAFNVGQGDSTLIELSSGELLLFDCHVNPFTGDPPVLEHLRSIAAARGGTVPDIALLCLTHPDRDHYRGLLTVLEWLKNGGGKVNHLILFEPVPKELHAKVSARLEELRTSDIPAHSRVPPKWNELLHANDEFVKLYSALMELKRHPDIGVIAIANGYRHVVTLSGAEIYVLGPTGRTANDHRDKVWDCLIQEWLDETTQLRINSNAISCVVWVRIGDRGILITGDSTREALESAVDEYHQFHKKETDPFIHCDVVKAPHHGSESSSSNKIWKAVLGTNAPFVIISAGCNHSYGHPHEKTLADIREASPASRILCTNLCPSLYERLAQKIAEIVEELEMWENDVVAAEKSELETILDGLAYHGRCTVQVCPTTHGDIMFETEHTPAVECHLHRLTPH